MTDQSEFLHTIHIDRVGPFAWRANIWRARFDDDGIIVGGKHVSTVHAWTRRGVRRRARRITRPHRSWHLLRGR